MSCTPTASELPESYSSSSLNDSDVSSERRAFQDTNWDWVHGAAEGNSLAMENLCARYMRPINAYAWRAWELRRPAYPNAEGKLDGDVLAAHFMTSVFTTEKFLANANPDKGRFRSYVLGALRNSVIDQCRTHCTQAEGGGYFRVDGTEIIDNLADADGLTPDQAMDHQMMFDAIIEVTKRLRVRWVTEGKGQHFDLLYSKAIREEDWEFQLKQREAAQQLRIPLGTVPLELKKLRESHIAGVRQYLCETCGVDDGNRIFNEIHSQHAAFLAFLERRRLEKNGKRDKKSE